MPLILRVNDQIARFGGIMKAGDSSEGPNRPVNCCCLDCPPCSGIPPISFEVVSTGWTEGTCGSPCLDWNQNFILDLNGPGQCRCTWSFADPIKCPELPASNTDGVFIKITDNGDGNALVDVGFTHNAVIACTDGEASYHYQQLFPLPLLCSAISSVIPFAFSGGFGGGEDACQAPAQITLIARPA